mgnify:CR=1 FL=1
MGDEYWILVFKKIYGDEAYKRAGTFPGAFEIGEDFNHYRTIFESKMGEDILKVKDKKYVGDGRKGQAIVSGPMKDREKEAIIKIFRCLKHLLFQR